MGCVLSRRQVAVAPDLLAYVQHLESRLAESRLAENTQDKQQVDDDKASVEGFRPCVVCMETTADTVLVPCGHLCMCERCAFEVYERTGRCPFCREEIEQTMRVYVPCASSSSSVDQCIQTEFVFASFRGRAPSPPLLSKTL